MPNEAFAICMLKQNFIEIVSKFQNKKTPSHFKFKSTAIMFKDKDYCPIEIIKGLTDKGQFQYLTKLMGPQEGTYLYATQFHSLR